MRGLLDDHCTGADLRRARLQGALMSGARLQGADLRGTDLEGAVLEEDAVHGAIVSDTTRWPQGSAPSDQALVWRPNDTD